MSKTEKVSIKIQSESEYGKIVMIKIANIQSIYTNDNRTHFIISTGTENHGFRFSRELLTSVFNKINSASKKKGEYIIITNNLAYLLSEIEFI